MKKIYKHILPAAVAVLTLAACGNEDAEPDVIRDFPTFSASIDGVRSRAADDYWENGDKIGISGGVANNVCHIGQIADALFIFTMERPEQQIYFRDLNPVTFTAYYPYTSSRDASTGLINITTADQANQKNFDFLWDKRDGSKSSPNVKFEFKHKMSKVTFVFKNGQNMDVSAINKIRLNGLVVEGTFNTTTGVCGVDEATPKASTTMLLTDVNTEKPVTPLYLFPQTVTESVKLEIYDTHNQYFVCNLSIPDNKLLAGYNYTYTITVNKTGLKVTGASLSDWIEKEDKSDASSAD